MKYTIKGIEITTDFDATEKELKSYIEDIKEKTHCEDSQIEKVLLTLKDNNVSIDYTLRGEKFERIRRITGSKQN